MTAQTFSRCPIPMPAENDLSRPAPPICGEYTSGGYMSGGAAQVVAPQPCCRRVQ